MSWTIARLGHEGDGIAEGPVYAPRTLPGEVVSGRLEGDRLTDLRILAPSDQRIKPPCPHYARCGGCALQHAGDDFVADWKQAVVISALAAQGIETSVRALHTSPPRSRRRAKLAGRRTKKGALVGFHGRQSDLLVAVPDCQVLLPQITEALPVLEDVVRRGGSRRGDLALTVTAAPAGLDLLVTGGKPLGPEDGAALARALSTSGFARVVWEDEPLFVATPPAQRFGPAQVVPPPGAFLQATAEGEAALVAAVREATAGASRIADLFAGCGTFALPLATQAEVHAVEGARPMTAALEAGWRGATGVKRLTCEARDLFRRPLLADELADFDALVLDPPRAGAQAQCTEIAVSGLNRVAYVSCNPVTFARDARLLAEAGFALSWIDVVDQFRWSSHVELVACLER